MKIQNSSVAMASTHHETAFTYREAVTMEAAKSKDAAGLILTISREASGKSMKESMLDYQKFEKEEEKKKQQENEVRSLQNIARQLKTNQSTGDMEISDEYDMEIKLLKRILAVLRGEKVPEECRVKPKERGNVADIRSAQFKKLDAATINLNSEKAVSLGSISIDRAGTNATGTTWQRITAVSGFHSESESTTFASSGIVQTADGRNIDFNVEVSMSRAFMQSIDMLEVKDYIKTDPLMINLDTNIGSVTDQKFFFDLDTDGKEEEISFAGKGSGFLALDINGDGKINDGSELFGTKSGDGFKDLAAYDDDGNGWIDENDSVFSRLKVWTKDESGRDYLINLKEADVGAIYLGNADTQFSLKNDENRLNGEIKKTGIFLRESTGAAGTLNHVDIAI